MWYVRQEDVSLLSENRHLPSFFDVVPTLGDECSPYVGQWLQSLAVLVVYLQPSDAGPCSTPTIATVYESRLVLQEKVVPFLELLKGRRFEISKLEMQVPDPGVFQSFLLLRLVFVFVKADDAVDLSIDKEFEGHRREFLIFVMAIVVGRRGTTELVSAGDKVGDGIPIFPSGFSGFRILWYVRHRCEDEKRMDVWAQLCEKGAL